MLCPKCGATMDEGETVCLSCGASIESADATGEAPAAEPEAVEPEAPDPGAATEPEDDIDDERPLDADATTAMNSLDSEAKVVPDEVPVPAAPALDAPVADDTADDASESDEDANDATAPNEDANDTTASNEDADATLAMGAAGVTQEIPPVDATEQMAPLQQAAPAEQAAPTGQTAYYTSAPAAPASNSSTKPDKHDHSATPGTDKFCGFIMLLLFLCTAAAGSIVLFLSFASGDYINYTVFLGAVSLIAQFDPSVSYLTVLLVAVFVIEIAFWVFWLFTVIAQLIATVRLFGASRKRYRSGSVALVLTMILSAIAPFVLVGLSALPSNLDAALILPLGASTVIGLLLPAAEFLISFIFIFIIKHLAHRKKERDDARMAQAQGMRA